MTFDRRDDSNPYAAPRADIVHRASPLELETDSEAELVRRHHLSHEASVKSVGLFSYLLGCFSLFFSAAVLLASLGVSLNPQAGGNANGPLEGLMLVFAAIFYGILGSVSLVLGYGLRRLQPWARWTTMVLSALALAYLLLTMVVVLAVLPVANPALATAIMGFAEAILAYVFYLLVSPKGSMVFSAEYKQVIARTPSIETRSSLIVRLLIGLIVFLLLISAIGGIATFLLGR